MALEIERALLGKLMEKVPMTGGEGERNTSRCIPEAFWSIGTLMLQRVNL